MEVLFEMQSDAGQVTGGYLDGNFNRTALMYGLYKTLGVTVSPWRHDVQLGAVLDGERNYAYVLLTASSPWKGALRFDSPRHRAFWHLPLEYPRLNGAPQWFVVEPERTYIVTDVATGRSTVESGRMLAEGLELELELEVNGETDGIFLRIAEGR